MPLKALWLLVVLVPLASSYLLDWAFWTAVGRPDRFLWGSQTSMLRAVLVSLPFLVLAMVATHARRAADAAWHAAVRRAAWLGIALNLSLWSVYHAIGVAADAGARPGAAAVAIGVIALLSPVWIGIAMHRMSKNR